MIEASHLSSMSLKVASGVDFFVGITAAAGAGFVAAALEVLFAGEEAFGEAAGEVLLVAAGMLLFSAAGDLSVVTDTLGSVAGVDACSGAAASGVGAGVVSSSCANARGAVARTNAVRARMVIFINISFSVWITQVSAQAIRFRTLRAADFGETNPIWPTPAQSRPI
jgi:hypothetical protein